MVKVKSETDMKKNYEASTADVPRRFEAGVKTAVWNAPAAAGQDVYEDRMADPDVLRRRLTGINRVSDEQWRNNTIDKGRGVIGGRMKDASGKWAERYRPYRETLESLTLTPRTADPIQNAQTRVTEVVRALVDRKRELG